MGTPSGSDILRASAVDLPGDLSFAAGGCDESCDYVSALCRRRNVGRYDIVGNCGNCSKSTLKTSGYVV